jgi:6-pyruvoyltetrahydropterin/6-carboxytetrahydropterin synthase
MYLVTLKETFTAFHSLEILRPEPHDHEWVVHVTLASEALAEPGIVVNYFVLQPSIRKMLPDGKNLNECFDFAPTAENLAKHFYDTLKRQFPQLVSVAVGEFEAFMCTYQPTFEQ